MAGALLIALPFSVEASNAFMHSRSSALAALLPVETASVAETIDLGRRLGAHLGVGDLVALYGDLGTGKTHFVKGVCLAHGVDSARVTSPTFTLVNEYTGGDVPIVHIDAYRIRHVEEMSELGFEAYLEDNLCLLEWPSRVEPFLPEDALRIRLEHAGSDRRRIAWVDAGEVGAP